MKLATFLAQTARRYPEREACICGDQALTFAALDARSSRIANALADAGLGVGERLLVFASNCLAMAELFASTLKLGAVMVPASTRLGPAELAHIVADAQPAAVACVRRDLPLLEAALGARPVLRVLLDGGPEDPGSLEALCRAGTETPPAPLPAQARAAAIVYTSGTTGKAKGAVVTHEVLAIQQLVNAVTQEITARERILVATPLAHRNGLSRLVATFCSGAPLILMPRFDPAETVRVANRHGATTLGAVTTMVRMLVEHLEAAGGAMPSLRVLQVSGEAFPAELKTRLARALPGVRMCTWYASTEAGVVATLMPEEQGTHPDSVGRPNPGMEVRITDAEGREQPVGEVGEIRVRCGEPGRCVLMEGYFRDPAATEEAMPGGWLRTGDAGRVDAEGFLYVVDRVKDMIVTGGLNVYAREVELCLAAHPEVREAAVVGVPDPTYGEAVYAFVVARGSTPPSPEALAEHCNSRMARYKRPRWYAFVASLPRTSTGKVLKPELRAKARAERAALDQPGAPAPFTGS